MAAKKKAKNRQHVVRIASDDVVLCCEHCDIDVSIKEIGDPEDELAHDQMMPHAINHYVEKHGYKLIHLGQETTHTPKGEIWHRSVAYVSHPRPPSIIVKDGVPKQFWDSED